MKLFKRFNNLEIKGAQADYYDKMAKEHRIHEIKEQAKEIAKYLKVGDSVLEVASGAGYLSIELSKLGKYIITGMDISNDLVRISSQNAKKAGADVVFQQGNASEMSYKASEFNFIICVFAFKNFKEPLKALHEMYRVLKPGGTALIMDLDRKATLKATKKVAENMGLRGFESYVAGAIQRGGAYGQKEIERFISQTSFKNYKIVKTDMGFSIFLNK